MYQCYKGVYFIRGRLLKPTRSASFAHLQIAVEEFHGALPPFTPLGLCHQSHSSAEATFAALVLSSPIKQAQLKKDFAEAVCIAAWRPRNLCSAIHIHLGCWSGAVLAKASGRVPCHPLTKGCGQPAHLSATPHHLGSSPLPMASRYLQASA